MYLSSAGLQQLLSNCDLHCAMQSITFNVFRCSMNNNCDITNVTLPLTMCKKTKCLYVLT